MGSDRCILCNSKRWEPLFEIPDLWLGRFDITANYFRCLNCGLICQDYQPDLISLDDLYPNDYPVFHTTKDKFRAWGINKRCKVVLKYKTVGSLIDIGSGNGEFIAQMQDHYHWKVVGIEPNENMAHHSRNDLDLTVFNKAWEQIDLGKNLFDAVTMWDVLEHLQNPIAVLNKIRNVLRPDGILVLRLPNYGSIDAKIFRQNWAGWDSPRHLFVFDKKTLSMILKQSGFIIISIETNIGEYLNFVKSIQFWMTANRTDPDFQHIFIQIISSPVMRYLTLPLTLIKNLCKCGSEMVVVARRSNPQNNDI
jgi:SAM-dependent methyltransferase